MPNDDERTLDINDPRLQQEMVEANPEADFFDIPAPPPDDRPYQVKVMLGEKGIVAKRQSRKGDPEGRPSGPYYLNASIECHIMDEGQPWDGRTLYENATSLIMQSSGTSYLHAILRALGYPALGRMSLQELSQHASGVLTSEPMCVVEGKWEARAQNGKGEWKSVKRGMKSFPLIDEANPDLGHSPVADILDPITRKPTGETARAQFKITKFYQPQ